MGNGTTLYLLERICNTYIFTVPKLAQRTTITGHHTVEGQGAGGMILAHQVKSLDLQVRKAEKQGKVSKTVLEEVVDKVRAILEDENLKKEVV